MTTEFKILRGLGTLKWLCIRASPRRYMSDFPGPWIFQEPKSSLNSIIGGLLTTLWGREGRCECARRGSSDQFSAPPSSFSPLFWCTCLAIPSCRTTCRGSIRANRRPASIHRHSRAARAIFPSQPQHWSPSPTHIGGSTARCRIRRANPANPVRPQSYRRRATALLAT